MASEKKVIVGGVEIGGGAPVSIQSMTDVPADDPENVAAQVRELAAAGCDIVRIAVPDMGCVDAAKKVRAMTKGIPLVADVHFDHRVAIAMCGHIDKIRLNPGTLENRAAAGEVARALIDTGTPLRIGTNTGSLPRDMIDKPTDRAQALVDAAARYVDELGSAGVTEMVVSVKSSNPATTLKANELAAEKFNLPLHLGVTESGTLLSGAVRSATILGSLLSRGIGDTIRVSLAGSPLPEARVAKEILSSLNLRRPGISVYACPGCGRSRMKTAPVAEKIEQKTASLTALKDFRIAVMGCEVNGPGEAADADLAIVGTVSGATLYRNGRIIKKGEPLEMAEEALRIITADKPV